INGDFSLSSDWLTFQSENIISYSNGVLRLDVNINSNYGSIYQTFTSDDKLYVYTKFKATSGTSIRLVKSAGGFVQSGDYIIATADGNFQTVSFINNETRDLIGLGIRSSLIGQFLEVDTLYAFSISTLIANKQYSPL